MVLRQPDPYISCVVGDIIHNLRSALDHVVIELIELAGNKPDRNSAFPIGSSSANFLTAVTGKMKCAPSAAIALVKTFEENCIPTGFIWSIHTLDIIDKHKTILTIATLYSITNLRIRYKGRVISLPKIELGRGDARASVALPLPEAAASHEITIQPRFKAARSIVFGKGQPYEGQDVLRTLIELVENVDGVVDRFSNSFMRMG